MSKLRVGVQIWPQHTSYASYAAAIRQVESLGVDTIWTWDHFFPLTGDPEGTHFEGWTLLTAMATLTTRAEIGCLVTCNSYRNPTLLAHMAKTVDHISNGRLILGIGAGWFERDYKEFGYTFGTAADRLHALEEALPLIKQRWAVENPPSVRNPIPILIGGGGEKITLKLAAQYANIWHTFGPLEKYKHKSAVLDTWCKEIGRNPAEIERSMSGDFDAADFDRYVEIGVRHFLIDIGEPWDFKKVEKLVKWRDSRAG